MQDKHKITEYDIFQYVFFPNELNQSKIKLIEIGKNYVSEIRFYQDLKEELGKELSRDIQKKLAELIPFYKLPEN